MPLCYSNPLCKKSGTSLKYTAEIDDVCTKQVHALYVSKRYGAGKLGQKHVAVKSALEYINEILYHSSVHSVEKFQSVLVERRGIRKADYCFVQESAKILHSGLVESKKFSRGTTEKVTASMITDNAHLTSMVEYALIKIV